MRGLKHWFLIPGVLLFSAACSKSPVEPGSAGGYRVYVSNETSGDMTVIDSSTLAAIATVPLGKRPRGIHASPDRRTIYVALSGSPAAAPGVDESTLPPPDKSADGIGVFDVRQNKVVRLIEGGSDPENFDVSLDGKTLFVSNEDAAGVSFVDITSGKLTKTIHTGEEPEGVKITPDGKFLCATSEEEGTVAVIDLSAGKLIKTIKVGRRPRSIAFTPDGSRAYVNAENDGTVVLIDAVKWEPIATIPIGRQGVIKPMAVLLASDASQLYVSTGRGHQLAIVDTATNQVTASIEVGLRPWGIGLSPDGKTLFTANGPSGNVSAVDLATKTVTRKIKCGGGPWGVITLPR